MTTPRTDDTVPHPEWAQTHTLPYAVPAESAPTESAPTESAPTESAVAGSAPLAGGPAPVEGSAVVPAPDTAPALNPPAWSGRKTAIAAALAIGFSSVGAVAAAAAVPAGSTSGGGQVQQGGFGPGGGQRGGFPGQRPQQGTQPGTQQGGTGQQQAPVDPNASTT